MHLKCLWRIFFHDGFNTITRDRAASLTSWPVILAMFNPNFSKVYLMAVAMASAVILVKGVKSMNSSLT